MEKPPLAKSLRSLIGGIGHRRQIMCGYLISPASSLRPPIPPAAAIRRFVFVCFPAPGNQAAERARHERQRGCAAPDPVENDGSICQRRGQPAIGAWRHGRGSAFVEKGGRGPEDGELSAPQLQLLHLERLEQGPQRGEHGGLGHGEHRGAGAGRRGHPEQVMLGMRHKVHVANEAPSLQELQEGRCCVCVFSRLPQGWLTAGVIGGLVDESWVGVSTRWVAGNARCVWSGSHTHVCKKTAMQEEIVGAQTHAQELKR